jgi:hypothetical protein
MTDEPERIWIDDERPIGGELHVFTDPPVKGVEQLVVGYIRADLAEAIVRAALERAAENYIDEGQGVYILADRILADLNALASNPAEVAAIIKAAGGGSGMRTIRLTIDLTYDERVMHGSEPESIEWFKGILLGDDLQLGDFGDLGDMIGSVKVVEMGRIGDE